MTDAADAFHSARQIFMVKDGVLYLAKPNITITHLQYMIEHGLVTDDRDPEYENIVRGYVLDGAVYCYQGHNFRSPDPAHDMRNAFRLLQVKLDLPSDTAVYFGVTKGEVGTQWHSPNGAHKLELVKWRMFPELK